jgi:hypothetical protein
MYYILCWIFLKDSLEVIGPNNANYHSKVFPEKIDYKRFLPYFAFWPHDYHILSSLTKYIIIQV